MWKHRGVNHKTNCMRKKVPQADPNQNQNLIDLTWGVGSD